MPIAHHEERGDPRPLTSRLATTTCDRRVIITSISDEFHLALAHIVEGGLRRRADFGCFHSPLKNLSAGVGARAGVKNGPLFMSPRSKEGS
jgi:hypothetical protein